MSALKKWFERRQTESNLAAYGPIGVYFTRDHLHVVQLKMLKGGGVGFQSHASLMYPESRTQLLSSPAATKILIRKAMRKGDFRGRTVVSAMPPEQVRVMSLSYPSNSAGNEASAIAGIMADRVEGALQDYVIDYVPIRMSSRDGDCLALVAVSSRDHVNNYLDNLASAGLHVDFLEIGPLAIKRLIGWGPASDPNNNVIVINIGKSTSRLTTISGHRLLADQEAQFGESTVLDALGESLNLAPDVARDLVIANGLDAARNAYQIDGKEIDREIAETLIEIVTPQFLKLAHEIDRAFLFADSESHGDRSRKLFIVGGISRWPGTDRLLASLVRMPVEILGRGHLPSARLSRNVESINDEQAAEMATAVGLALRGMLADE